MTGIIFRETSEEFRKGFEFCTKAIYDMIHDREGYTLELLDQTLHSMVILMDNGKYWPDIKKVILRE